MEQDNIERIIITDFNTIKCSDFEVSFTDFFKRLSRLIVNDSQAYNVLFYRGNYIINYNNKSYFFMESKEQLNEINSNFVNYLDELISLSNFQRSLARKENNETNKKDSERDKTLEEATLKSRETIRKLKESINDIKSSAKKNNSSIWQDTFDLVEKINVGREHEIYLSFRAVMGAGAVIGTIGYLLSIIFGGPFNPFLLGVLLIEVLDGSTLIYEINKQDDLEMDPHYRGIYLSIISIILLPLLLGYSTVTKIVDKVKLFKEIRKIKKHLRELENKEILDSKREKIINNFFKKGKEIDGDKGKLIISPSLLEEIKNKLLLIEDPVKRKEIGFDLYMATGFAVNLVNNTDNVQKYERLIKLINIISQRIDKVLQEETEKGNSVITSAHYKLMTEVNEKKEEIKEETFVKQKIFGKRN